MNQIGENLISERDTYKLAKWPAFPDGGEYNNIEFIRIIDIFQEDFHITDGMIVGTSHSLFARTANNWYYKRRQEHGKHDCLLWKSEIITKLANTYWRFKMENYFISAIFYSKTDKPLIWFLKQKDGLSALHPDMSDSMINMEIFRKFEGELEYAIKCRCLDPF
ncbi:hypothetical protein O181_046550 [Austropuccinia psidii MF-1]|uniref:Uncharacterized protein n=1 Tax=Austropuccinia psidii MF-1 TaxID=1389203 RepID=A0A9Q3DNQ7_9BASI|nr:hypothetical protein [Austropuccinia psidii MF-1]